MSKIVRVNMSTKAVQIEEVPEKYAKLGGRALTSQIVLDEVEPTCHPLGPQNKLVFAPGLLSGTSAPSSGRLSIGGKSPLTGTIKESNAGGITAQKLANAGIKALIIEGKPKDKEFSVLKITPDTVELLPGDKVAGKGTYDTTAILRQEHGAKAAVVSIGPAGEMLMANAGIANCDSEGNSSRYAGRGGLGSVLGAKGLKAIVVDAPGSFNVPLRNPEAFKTAAQKFSQILLSHPVCGTGLAQLGTNVLMNIINESGALPTKNFSRGRFEQANNIGGETLAKVAVERGGLATHACHPGCVMRCSNAYPLPNGKVCSPIEYESAWALGAHCEIDNLDVVGTLNYICNDVGLDTIEAGGTLGILMEAGVIPWGDGAAAIKALEEVGQGTSLGRIIGQGAAFTAQAFGVTKVAVVKGQHMPAYDPRAAKGIGVTYATTTMGADHTAGYAIATNILKSGGYVDPLQKEGQVELSRNLQIATAVVDTSGLCLFVAFAFLDNPEALPTFADMLNAQYGLELTVNDLMGIGAEVLKVEQTFNQRAGFTKEHDRLPEFFYKETLPPHNTVFDINGDELDQTLNF